MTAAETQPRMLHFTDASVGPESGEPMSETISFASEMSTVIDEQHTVPDRGPAIDAPHVPGIVVGVGTEKQLTPMPVPWRHPLQAAMWIVRTLFGLLSLIVLLAIVAAIPVVNLLALGYLLEVEGRVGRSGKLRDAFPLLHLAPRFGSIVLGIWLWLIPLRLLAGAATDAQLIDPGSPSDTRLHLLLSILWVAVTVHLCLALARGGSLSSFFRPLKNVRWFRQRLKAGDYLDTASAHVREFVSALRIKHHFWLGLRGLIGAIAWLLLPTALFAAMDGSEGPQLLVTIIGGALLALVLSWMPFLQARFATEQRLRSMFHWKAIRRLFKHAPLAWLLAVAVVYVLALPLYLLKVVLLPQDAYWLITLIFIASIYPSKVAAGWAYHRAVRGQAAGETSSRVCRWSARMGLLPLLVGFVFLLYFTQFIGAHGTAGLFEHHAFLLPWPGDPG